MASISEFARFIGRLHPEAWDWIVPHGPVRPGGRFDRVALNPQPLPPRMRFFGPEASAAVAARAAHDLVGQIAQAAIVADLSGRSGIEVLRAEIDDWCGQLAPAHPVAQPLAPPAAGSSAPRPRRGPDPGPPEVLAAIVLAAGGLGFADLAGRLDTDIGQAALEGSEAMFDAAMRAAPGG